MSNSAKPNAAVNPQAQDQNSGSRSPTAQDILNKINEVLGSSHAEVTSEDRAKIISDLLAAIGAPLPVSGDQGDPTQAPDGGFWRVIYNESIFYRSEKSNLNIGDNLITRNPENGQIGQLICLDQVIVTMHINSLWRDFDGDIKLFTGDNIVSRPYDSVKDNIIAVYRLTADGH